MVEIWAYVKLLVLNSNTQYCVYRLYSKLYVECKQLIFMKRLGRCYFQE